MLIHKDTMGVLEWIWTGELRTENGVSVPAERPATLADVEDPGEWWEISGRSDMARTARLYYPWLTPDVDEQGELVGLTPQREVLETGEQDRAALEEQAREKGYKRAGRKAQRKNVMPFLRSGG